MTTPPTPANADGAMDVNAIVYYNLRAIRRQRGMTQDDVADGLARLTATGCPKPRFFDGFQVGCLVAAGVLFIGAAFAARFLPARPAPPADLADLEFEPEPVVAVSRQGDEAAQRS
jgi:hypothetical protein